jgi:glycosyltransferase involved in cell wall biosynthesis
MPYAVEQFDLRGYQTVISMSDAVAHGALTGPDQLHVNYVYTPMRYAWRLYQEYLDAGQLSRGLRGFAARLILHYIRQWDFAASARVDAFIACSNWIARDVWRVYRRTAEVIYPPVDVDRFNPNRKRDDFFLTVTRLVPYKHVEMIVAAFNEVKLPLVIVGEGPEYNRIKRQAGPTVEVRGWLPEGEVTALFERARGFVHAAEEDFGISVVEALAAGCPVIAYGRGGALESVKDGETGCFFQRRTIQDLSAAVMRIQNQELRFDPAFLHASVENFRKGRFQEEFSSFVSGARESFRRPAG